MLGISFSGLERLTPILNVHCVVHGIVWWLRLCTDLLVTVSEHITFVLLLPRVLDRKIILGISFSGLERLTQILTVHCAVHGTVWWLRLRTDLPH